MSNPRVRTFLLSYQPGVTRDLHVVSPLAAHAIERAGRPPSLSNGELLEIFESDPFLTAKALGVANYYVGTRGKPLMRLSQALDVVGRDYAIGLLRQSVPLARHCDHALVHDLWDHCVSVARIAKELAHASGGRYMPEEAYVLGLIHDLGYFVEIKYDIHQVAQVVARIRSDEEDGIHDHHADLGEALARFWCLPPRASRAIRSHHDPIAVMDDDCRGLCALILLAEAKTTGSRDAPTLESLGRLAGVSLS